MYIVKKIDYKGHTIEIASDDDPLNPRVDSDNFGHMVCLHGRYNLGDKHDFKYSLDIKEYIEQNKCVWLSLYLYDHSGITMSYKHSYPYNDRWDAGQVGIIYATYEDIKKEFSVKRITKQAKAKAIKILEGEVETYDSYIRGDVWGYIIKDKTGEEKDSCWGFLGDMDYCIEEAKGVVDFNVKQTIKKHIEEVKGYIKNNVNIQYRKPLAI
jgi:hypothetical protein